MLSAEIVGKREDSAEVIRRVAPLRSEPSVVEVEPTNHRADIKCGRYRFELVTRTRYTGASTQLSTGHNRPEKLRASGVVERENPAAERIEQTPVRRVACYVLGRIEFRDVAGDLSQERVGGRTLGRARSDMSHQSLWSQYCRQFCPDQAKFAIL